MSCTESYSTGDMLIFTKKFTFQIKKSKYTVTSFADAVTISSVAKIAAVSTFTAASAWIYPLIQFSNRIP